MIPPKGDAPGPASRPGRSQIVYAVIRFENVSADDAPFEVAVKVTEIRPTEVLAERECRRLNKIVAVGSTGARYAWQPARYFPA